MSYAHIISMVLYFGFISGEAGGMEHGTSVEEEKINDQAQNIGTGDHHEAHGGSTENKSSMERSSASESPIIMEHVGTYGGVAHYQATTTFHFPTQEEIATSAIETSSSLGKSGWLFTRAMIRMDELRFKEAEDDFLSAGKEGGVPASLQLWLGKVAFYQEHWKEAEEYFIKLLQLPMPTDHELTDDEQLAFRQVQVFAHWQLGLTKLIQGNVGDALKELKSALSSPEAKLETEEFIFYPDGKILSALDNQIPGDTNDATFLFLRGLVKIGEQSKKESDDYKDAMKDIKSASETATDLPVIKQIYLSIKAIINEESSVSKNN